jgi:hypothetical protein
VTKRVSLWKNQPLTTEAQRHREKQELRGRSRNTGRLLFDILIRLGVLCLFEAFSISNRSQRAFQFSHFWLLLFALCLSASVVKEVSFLLRFKLHRLSSTDLNP